MDIGPAATMAAKGRATGIAAGEGPGDATGDAGGGAMDGVVIRGAFDGELVRYALCDYAWDDAPQDEWRADEHVLDMALTPRPRPAWAHFADDARRAPRPLGQMIFVPAGRALRSGAARGRLSTITCVMAPQMFERTLGHAPQFDAIDEGKALHMRDREIEALLLEVHRELRAPGFASEVRIEALSQEIAAALVRSLAIEPRPDWHRGGMAPWRMRRIRERVAQQDLPMPALAELAELCGMSVRHLTRTFKAETGQTVAAYVQDAAIARAEFFLTETDLPVSRIASELGFASATSFCYAFRRAVGQRPGEVRALAGKRGARGAPGGAPRG